MPKTNLNKQLVSAFQVLKSDAEVESFLQDLLTNSEIEEFAKRLEIARLLWTTNLSYIEIAQKIATSTTTVSRVANWLYKEKKGGYRRVLQQWYGPSKR